MSPSRGFKPPEPVGEPFRGNPKDPVPFTTEGAPVLPPVDDAMTPWMSDSALPSIPQGPPSHAPTGPPSPSDANSRPQFRAPPAVPKDPAKARQQRLGKLGIFAGVASIVISPLLGPVAIALGIAAIRRGEIKLGSWAVSTGVAGTLIGIVVAVLVLTGVIDPNQILQNFRNQK